MKYLFVLLIAIAFSSCSTFKQASTDFSNFRKTLEYNATQPVVYQKAYF